MVSSNPNFKKPFKNFKLFGVTNILEFHTVNLRRISVTRLHSVLFPMEYTQLKNCLEFCCISCWIIKFSQLLAFLHLMAILTILQLIKKLHTVSFDWFLSSLEWILNLEFCLIKLLKYQKLLWTRSDLGLAWSSTSVNLDMFDLNNNFLYKSLQLWSHIEMQA